MAKTKKGRKSAVQAVSRTGNQSLDGIYLLKLVLYLIIGAQWLRLTNSSASATIPIPIGLLIGVLFASHDHFQIDRKIEYALLLVAMFVGFWAQIGGYITY